MQNKLREIGQVMSDVVQVQRRLLLWAKTRTWDVKLEKVGSDAYSNRMASGSVPIERNSRVLEVKNSSISP